MCVKPRDSRRPNKVIATWLASCEKITVIPICHGFWPRWASSPATLSWETQDRCRWDSTLIPYLWDVYRLNVSLPPVKLFTPEGIAGESTESQ